jgi:hypothetical protein
MAVVKSYWQYWAPPVFGRQEIPHLRSEQAPQSLPTCLCGALSYFVIARIEIPRLCSEQAPQSLRWTVGLTRPAH